MNYLDCSTADGGQLRLRFRLTLCGAGEPERYRVLGKFQIGEPGCGRNPGLMRNYMSESVPSAECSGVWSIQVVSSKQIKIFLSSSIKDYHILSYPIVDIVMLNVLPFFLVPFNNCKDIYICRCLLVDMMIDPMQTFLTWINMLRICQLKITSCYIYF